MSKALDNVVVLYLTTAFWSSIGTAVLGDFGAQVIKIADLSAPGAAESSAGWDYKAELAQRNKLSLALDLDQDAGRAIVRELVPKVDVFVTDWPRARIDQHRFDYASLCALRPDIIYAHATGFGPKGPDRDLPALDELAAARTGMMPILPQPGQPPPPAKSR